VAWDTLGKMLICQQQKYEDVIGFIGIYRLYVVYIPAWNGDFL
jgi:hypothetical protein